VATMPIWQLLESNGIRVLISPTPHAHELHKPPFGVAVCAVGGITKEHVEILKGVRLAGWYCTYSFEQGEEHYSGYIISYSVPPFNWQTEAAVRAFLEEEIELACEKCGGEGTYFSTHEIPAGSRYYCECDTGRALMEADDV
jgi:hypothetical protein